MPAGEVAAEVDRLLAQVGLSAGYVQRYPLSFRAASVSASPSRVRFRSARRGAVADEAVSGLDVSIQAQVLNLLVELRDRLGLTMVFISHDLGVVEYLSTRIAVMYLGRILESGPASAVFRRAGHPCTQALIRAIPGAGPGPQDHARGGERRPAEPGQPARAAALFRTRCPKAQDICATMGRPQVTLGRGHWAALPFRHRAGAVAGPPRRQFIALNGHRNEGIEE